MIVAVVGTCAGVVPPVVKVGTRGLAARAATPAGSIPEGVTVTGAATVAVAARRPAGAAAREGDAKVSVWAEGCAKTSVRPFARASVVGVIAVGPRSTAAGSVGIVMLSATVVPS